MLDALAHLPDDAKLTLTVAVGDVRRAIDKSAPGPERVSTTWCVRELGFSARKWREWCEAGRVSGAKKDGAGRWRLPNRAAREHFARVLETPGKTPDPRPPEGSPGADAAARRRAPPDRRKPRGPWKKKGKIHAISGGPL